MNKNVKSTAFSLVVLLSFSSVLIHTGCSQQTDVSFRQDIVLAHKNLYDSNTEKFNAERQQEVANVLTAIFGTPDKPNVPTGIGLNASLIKNAAGKAWNEPDQTIVTGLFRKHCVHCHGVTGDGKGPTAIFMNPYPRDFRKGWFKFKSNDKAAMPTDDDLTRTIREGLNGTYMPSFKSLLDDQEIKVMVEYVKYLSMRGQTEKRLMQQASELEEGEFLPRDENSLLGTINSETGLREGGLVSEATVLLWSTAEGSIITPEKEPKKTTTEIQRLASIARGRALFVGKADCKKCHGITALGDGQIDFDDWNKDITEDDVNKYGALPKQELRPRNLRLGFYRGGSRPLDIYRKIRTGIGGTLMPATKIDTLSDDEAWDLVHYVLNLPYESASQPRKQRVENTHAP